jgi:tRNA(His) guanylyltransferase
MSVADKNELLFQRGINYNSLPTWQKRGIGFYYGIVEKQALNPKTGLEVKTNRRKLIVNEEIPINEEYGKFLKGIMNLEL